MLEEEMLEEGIQYFKASAIFEKALKALNKRMRKGEISEDEIKPLVDMFRKGMEEFEELEERYEDTEDKDEKKSLKREYNDLKQEYSNKLARAKKVSKDKGKLGNEAPSTGKLVMTGVAANVITPIVKKLLKVAAITGAVAVPVGIFMVSNALSSIDTSKPIKEEFDFFPY